LQEEKQVGHPVSLSLLHELALQRKGLGVRDDPESAHLDWTHEFTISSNLFAVEVLQLVLDIRHEFVGDGTVDQAVIETERQVRHRPNRDRIVDLATRARAKQLKNEEVHGGTFTVTNPGTLGAQFGMPIINQPQLAILGVGTIEKRPVVIDDGIAIRLRSYLTLGFDHRLIDGVVADQFMALIKDRIEHFDPAAV